MNSRKELNFFVILIVVLLSTLAQAKDLVVEGVFGLEPVSPETALAIWVPLSEDAAIEGVRWYNNDMLTAFPEVLAVAGEPNRPDFLSRATVIGVDVVGLSEGWSEFYFDQPLASETPGLYLVFRLPVGGEYRAEGEGGGAGIGYSIGDGVRRCWVTGDGENWDPMNPEMQIAAKAIIRMDKSGDVLVLGKASESGESLDDSDLPIVEKLDFFAKPNPFNPQTEIQFTLGTSGYHELDVFDVRGQLVRTLARGYLEAGPHSQEWNGKDNKSQDMASGVYFVRLKSGVQIKVLRLALVR